MPRVPKELDDFVRRCVHLLPISTEKVPFDFEEAEAHDKKRVYDVYRMLLVEWIKTKQKLIEFKLKQQEKLSDKEPEYWQLMDEIFVLKEKKLDLEVDYFSKKYFSERAAEKIPLLQQEIEALSKKTNIDISNTAVQVEATINKASNNFVKQLGHGLLVTFYEKNKTQSQWNELYSRMKDYLERYGQDDESKDSAKT